VLINGDQHDLWARAPQPTPTFSEDIAMREFIIDPASGRLIPAAAPDCRRCRRPRRIGPLARLLGRVFKR
jgi:hypothetical protein